MTNAELIEYYKNLLILQYKNQTKAPDHIKALIDSGMIFELIEEVENAFDIDTAIGVQQDVLGEYLGINRIINGIPFFLDYFGFMEYGDNPSLALFEPFMEYGDVPPAVEFYKYGGSVDVLELNDADFRQLQQFAVIKNNILYSLGDVDDALYSNFGLDVQVVDNFDMTIIYEFPLAETQLALVLQSEDLLPRPMGVELSIDFV